MAGIAHFYRRLGGGVLGAVCGLLAAAAAWAQPAASEGTDLPRLGVLTDNYPFSFRDADGPVKGFVYELAQEIEATMGLHFARVEGSTAEINGAFVAGRLDMLQSYAEFPERKGHADFSVPYLTMAGAIFVRDGERGIKTLADLRGRRVLVHRGSLGETVLRNAGLGDAIVPVDSVEQALTRVDRGEGDATLVGRLSGLSAAHRLGVKHLRVLDAKVAGYDVRYCFAVKPGDRELLARVNEGLATLVRTGKFARLYEKWFGHLDSAGYTAEQVMLAVLVGLTLALAVTLWAVVRQRTLRGRIAQQAEALRVSEERHRGIFEGARDGLLVLGRGAGDFVVEQANPAAGRLMGQTAGAPAGLKLGAWLGADSTLATRLRSAAAAGRTDEFEHERAGGGWIRVGVHPLGPRTVVTLADIGEQVEARQRLAVQEEKLRQKQKLEAVGTLAGGVAHDFNNLLTSILGNTELALMNLPPQHPDAEGLRQALRAARRARDLVRQILTFSRQTAPSREVLLARPLVDETINLLRTLAKGAVEFDVKLPPDLPPLLADPVQVHQVLMNIGANAVQAMRGAPGRLSFRAEAVQAGAELCEQFPELKPGRYVRIDVQDTGPGMPEDVQRRVFEPFFTTKAPGEGTGLGLSVVHGIMEQHGGAVALYSQPGRGTRFHLYFPEAPRHSREADLVKGEVAPVGRGERVIFVDDDATIVETARKMFTRLGYEPVTHARADEAFAEWAAAPEQFAAIVSDLAMPGMNGLQLLARVRAADTAKPVVPFVLMSGFFSEEETAEARMRGVSVLLQKPLDYDGLGRAIATVLGRRAA